MVKTKKSQKNSPWINTKGHQIVLQREIIGLNRQVKDKKLVMIQKKMQGIKKKRLQNQRKWKQIADK